MLSTNKRDRIHLLMQQEIVPSIGCTEPVAVALCTAKASSTLGRKVEQGECFIDEGRIEIGQQTGITDKLYIRIRCSGGSESAVMAMENEVVTSQEGIVDEDIDKTIENMARIGKSGMLETDQLVLDIMTKK